MSEKSLQSLFFGKGKKQIFILKGVGSAGAGGGGGDLLVL
jgi:hypothetical protein